MNSCFTLLKDLSLLEIHSYVYMYKHCIFTSTTIKFGQLLWSEKNQKKNRRVQAAWIIP